MKLILKNTPSFFLALVFIVFGSNYFLQFIPMQSPAGDAGTFLGLLFSTKYLLVVKVLEILIGLLLIFPKTRALALLLIAPIVVNILLFELLIAKMPGIGILLLVVNVIAIYQLKEKYISIIK